MKCSKSRRTSLVQFQDPSDDYVGRQSTFAQHQRSAYWLWTHANGSPMENAHMYKGPGRRSDSPQHNHDRRRILVPTPELPVSHSLSHCLRYMTGTLISPLTRKNLKLKPLSSQPHENTDSLDGFLGIIANRLTISKSPPHFFTLLTVTGGMRRSSSLTAINNTLHMQSSKVVLTWSHSR